MAARKTATKTTPADGLTVDMAMPASPSLGVVSLPQQNEPEYSQEELDEMSVAQRVRSLMHGDVEDRIKIRVYRRLPNQARSEFVAEYTLAEYEDGDLPMIRREWGSGTYEIRAIGPEGVLTRKIESIAAPAVSSPIAERETTTNMENVLARMVESQNAILQALTARPDPQSEMMRTLSLMTAMREAMGLTGGATQVAAPASPTAVLNDVVAAIKQLRSVSEDINPPAKTEPESLMGMVPQVLELVKAGMSQNSQPQFPAVQLPSSLNVDQQTTEGENVGLQQLMLAGLFGRLFQMAEQNASPTDAANYLLDKLPDEALSALEMPNWLEILTAITPPKFKQALVTHAAWVALVRDAAVAMLNEPEDPAQPG